MAAGAWSSTSASRMTASGAVATRNKTGCSRIWRTSMRLCVLLRSARSIIIGNSTLTIRTFLFSPRLSAPPPACTANFGVLFFAGPTGDRGALQCHWNAIATQQNNSSGCPGCSCFVEAAAFGDPFDLVIMLASGLYFSRRLLRLESCAFVNSKHISSFRRCSL